MEHIRNLLGLTIEMVQDIAPEVELPSLSHKTELDSEAIEVIRRLPPEAQRWFENLSHTEDRFRLQVYAFIRYVRELLSVLVRLDEADCQTLPPLDVGLYEVSVYGDGRVYLSPNCFKTAMENLGNRKFKGIRKCDFCGRLFFARRKDKRYCQASCRTKSWQFQNSEKWKAIQLTSNLKRSKKEQLKD